MIHKERIILGIDPGTTLMGYGVIAVKGRDTLLNTMGVIELHKYTDPFLKLQKIYHRVSSLIEEYDPTEMALEAPFLGKNAQSMLKLGRAQGVALSAALNCNLPVFEYAPRKIKMSITGQGNASKEQVARMLRQIYKFKDMPKDLDATDGLAAALCHFYQFNPLLKQDKVKSWKAFINQNPNRIK